MIGGAAVTSGGAGELSGESARWARRIALLVYLVIGSAFAAVNAVSELDERTRMGRAVDGWEPWAWEFTSMAGFLVIAPLIIRAGQRLSPPRLSWPQTVGLHLLLSIPASIAHSLTMIGLRHAIYWGVSDDYHGAGALGSVLLYEYRKDLITYALLALLPLVVARFRGPTVAPAGSSSSDTYRVEIRDGSRTRWLAPGEIEWAQSAGNYVEIHGAFGSLLHRATLALLVSELEPFGFAQVHRSRLVRKDAVCGVETRPSGDFQITLASGEQISGSRRFRSNLM
jgi:hypothetical protein